MSTLPNPPPEVAAELLQAAEGGDLQAAERLVPVLYEELKKLARARLKRLRPGQTLQTTALVHEAYLRLIPGEDPGWSGRAHFFGAAARAMRFILVERARRKASAKHGGGRRRDDGRELPGLEFDLPADDVLDLDAALERLEALNPEKAKVVSLRFFAGLTMEDVAQTVGRPLRSVERDWRFARAWLRKELGEV